MPTWKTFDENTAAALKQRLEEEEVALETLTQPLFETGDSVVIAPTLQKGAALVITARRNTASSPVPVIDPVGDLNRVAAPAQPELAGETSAVPEAQSEWESGLPPVAEAAEIATPVDSQANMHEIESIRASEEPPAEFMFGPSTWERAETSDAVLSAVEHQTTSADPEIWDIPSEAPPQSPANAEPMAPWNDATQSEPPVIESTTAWDDDRHVATGFLGLGDYVEDEEEIARSKRPWWKKIFSD